MPVLTEKMFTNVKVVCTTGTVMDTTDSIVHTTNRNNVKMRVSLWNAKYQYLGEQGWRSGESARLPPMWPGFKSRRWRHLWGEFVVGAPPCPERFFSRYSGFPLSSKTNISKFQFDQESGRRRTTVDVLPANRYLFIIYLFISRGDVWKTNNKWCQIRDEK